MRIEKKAVATKLTVPMYAKFEALADKFGMTRFDLLQQIIATLLRYFDGEIEISKETHTLMQIFEGMNKDPNTFSICMMGSDCEVVSAIYFIKQKGKPVPQPVHVCKDGTRETYNIDTMAKALIRAYDANLLRDVERAKGMMENFSIMQTIRQAVKMAINEDYDLCEDIRQIFDEAQKHAYANEREFEYNKEYKRTHGYDFELVATGSRSYNELNGQVLPTNYEAGDGLPVDYEAGDGVPTDYEAGDEITTE